ncbi:MAG: hypothetical protein AAF745_01340, partial [Planctomycetota bacterium]
MPSHPYRAVVIAGVILLIASSMGCRGRRLLPPPGPINQQASNDIIHDPYPQDDIAPGDAGG